MPAPFQGTSSDLSNVAAIVDAVYDIALTKSGLTWTNSAEMEFPTAATLADPARGGFPFLVVTCPDFAGYTREAEGASREMIRDIGLTEPSWLINVYSLHGYTAGDKNSWLTPLKTLAQLLQTFTVYWGLEGTCSHQQPMEPRVRKIWLQDSKTPLMEAVLPIRAYEALIYQP